MRFTILIKLIATFAMLTSQALAKSSSPSNKSHPINGPGLGNIAYETREVFEPISRIQKAPQGDVPKGRPNRKAFGQNVGIMLNGYFVTLFAPDGGAGPGGWLVYDISNPRDITLVRKIYEPEGITSKFRESHSIGVSTIDGIDYVAVQTIEGLEFWDFTDVNNIRPVSNIRLPKVNGGDYSQVAWQLWWQAPYVYVTGGDAGVFIVDASDPKNPVLANRGLGKTNPVPPSELGGFRVGPIFTLGNQMMVSSMESRSGMSMLDISDPLNPIVVGNLPFAAALYYATCFDGAKIYTATRNSNPLEAYDVTNPTSFVRDTARKVVTNSLYCATQDHFLFEGAQTKIHKLDVSNPARYTEVGSGTLSVPNPDHGQVAVFGNLVFVGNDHGTGSGFIPHQAEPDNTPPTVKRVSPAEGAANQAVTSRIGVALSDSILPESVNVTSFVVRPQGGKAIAGFYSVQLGMVNFGPEVNLLPNTTYEVVLKKDGLQDYAGNGLAAQKTWTFTTGSNDGKTVNSWSLSGNLKDTVGRNNGTEATGDVYAEGGLNFAGRAEGVQLKSTNTAVALGGSATLSLHMKTNQKTTSTVPSQAPGIFGRNPTGGAGGVFWGWLDSNGHLNFSVGAASSSNLVTRSASPVNDNQWHHVVMTRDATTGARALYIDGNKTSTTGMAGILGQNNLFKTLGRIEGSPELYQGLLSRVRVFNHYMPDSDVAVLVKEESLTFHWPLSTNLVDKVRENNGVASNKDVFTEGGLDTTGRTSAVTLARTDIAWVLGGTSSVSLFLKTTQTTSGDVPWRAPGIFGRDRGKSDDDIFWGWINNTGHLKFTVGNAKSVTSPERINDGIWHHAVMTRDATTGLQKMYVDGVQRTRAGPKGIRGQKVPFKLLGQIEGNPERFLGHLSDIKVFNRVLEDDDVTALSQTPPINHWALNQNLLDQAGGNNGRQGSADDYEDGGLNFAARSGGVELTDKSLSSILGGTASVSLFMRTTQTTQETFPWRAPGIFGRDQVNDINDHFWGWLDRDGRLNISVGDAYDDNPNTRSHVRVNDGRWHHIAMTRNAVTGEKTIAVDGFKVTTKGTKGPMSGVTYNMLGQIEGVPDFFRGVLSDVRVYNRILTDQEFSRLRAKRPAVLGQSTIGQAVSFNPALLGLDGTRYLWRFGDGTTKTTTSRSPIARHTYKAPGHYTVTVQVTLSGGGTQFKSYLLPITRPLTTTTPTNSSNIVGDANNVYSVNRDSGTVTAIDAQRLSNKWEAKVGDTPTTLALGPSNRLWVAVQGSDKLVALARDTGATQATINLSYGSRPYGVVISPDSSKGLISLEGSSELVVFDPISATISRTLSFPAGSTPRGIAVTGDSSTAFVTRFKSQNSGGQLYKVNLSTLAPPTTIALPVDRTTVDNEDAARGVPNYLSQVVISPDGVRAVLPSKKDNIVGGMFNDGTELRHDSTVRSVLNQVQLSDDSVLTGAQIDFDDRSPARAAAFTPLGNYIFVALMENNAVAIVDAYSGAVKGQISDTGITPDGLYLDARRSKLFTNSFLGRSVSAHDVSGILRSSVSVAKLAGRVQTVQNEPLTQNVLAGKKIFYNAADVRMSRDNYMSCASCHADGGEDGMVWDFTQRGEGLRRTISLEGRRGTGHGKLHWSANFDEVQDFENDIRAFFGGTGFMTDDDFAATRDPLGVDKKEGLSTELDRLSDYLTSLNKFPKSAALNAQGCPTANAIAGRAVFQKENCASCHSGDTRQDGLRHDVVTITDASGKGNGQSLTDVGIDTPTLLGLWHKRPYRHNGSAATLSDVFAGKGVHADVKDEDRANLVAYLNSLDGRNNSCTSAPASPGS